MQCDGFPNVGCPNEAENHILGYDLCGDCARAFVDGDVRPTFKTERRDEGIFTEIYILLEDGPLRHWSAHRIICSKYDIGAAGACPPEPCIFLVGFGRDFDELPAYIASVQEVERQARALREEKQAEYREWRASLTEAKA